MSPFFLVHDGDDEADAASPTGSLDGFEVDVVKLAGSGIAEGTYLAPTTLT